MLQPPDKSRELHPGSQTNLLKAPQHQQAPEPTPKPINVHLVRQNLSEAFCSPNTLHNVYNLPHTLERLSVVPGILGLQQITKEPSRVDE